MHCLINAIIIMLVILLSFALLRTIFPRWFDSAQTFYRESMTRIRRTVGIANDADEQRVAAGVVNSLPIFDYTYSYWDGVQTNSCDECPNKVSCPHCPQFQVSKPSDVFTTRDGGKHTREFTEIANYHNVNIMENGPELSAPNTTPAGVEYFDDCPTVHKSDDTQPLHDLDSGYTSSRERMGACSSRKYSHNRAAGYIARDSDFGEKTDDKFDQAKISLGARKPSGGSAIKLLYNDVMSIPNEPPARDECEYFGRYGYLYKEPCN